MPRPRKCRRVCCLPRVCEFGPSCAETRAETVSMSVEEYEVIRLMDLEGLSQEESAQRMEVARSTVQRIYDEARRKIADSIVNGKRLKIHGGNYRLCEESNPPCRCAGACCAGKTFSREKNETDGQN